jgi:hypothetical protein
MAEWTDDRPELGDWLEDFFAHDLVTSRGVRL